MFCLPGLPRVGLSQHKDLRILEFSRSILPKYDICCLQEVFYFFNSRKESLSHTAQLAGFPFQARSARPGLFSTDGTDGGLLTLSRYPIVEEHFEPYSYGHASDSFAQKGFLYTKIVVGASKYLHVFNTHLNASYFDKHIENLSAQIDIRVKSLQLIRDYMKTIVNRTDFSRSDNFFMVCGDLNIDSFGDKENFEEQGRKTPVMKALFEEILADGGVGKEELLRKFKKFYTEYDNIGEVFADYGWKAVDHLGIRLKSDPSMVQYTLGDIIEKKDGTFIPRDQCLTVDEDFGHRQRLDYILEIQLDKS